MQIMVIPMSKVIRIKYETKEEKQLILKTLEPLNNKIRELCYNG